MPYRIEISPNGRATCSATHCKKAGTRIEKGEIRQGVVVMFKDNQTWKYRHWGCVTPEVIHNWKDESGGDMDLVDGYDTLPANVQEKVNGAFEQGHVDDDDWNGDIECNRYTGKKSQGMFVKTPKKKAKKGEEDDEGEAEPTPAKKQATKKRARATEDDDEAEEKPAPKKGRAKKAAKLEDEDDEAESAPPAKKSRKTKEAKDEDADEEESKAKPAAQKTKAKKAKTSSDVEEDDEALAVKPAAAKKTRAKKAAKPADDGGADDEPAPEPKKTKAPKGKGRGKKAAVPEDD